MGEQQYPKRPAERGQKKGFPEKGFWNPSKTCGDWRRGRKKGYLG
jgi:hypothetical protein